MTEKPENIEIPPNVEVIDLTGLSDSGDEHNPEEEDLESEHASEGSEIEITLNQETRAQLQTAIATVSETRLRRLLKILVEADVTIEAALTRELVTLKRGTQDVVPRWETCANCDEEYDINTVREDAECIFHPGELDLVEEAFEDWDDDCHGPKDTAENRRHSPSPYPPSSPSVTSDDEDIEPLSGLRSSIAALSETKLRAILLKLADSNPRFQRAITKEVAYAQPLVDSPPTTPTNAKHHRKRRSKTRNHCKNLSGASTPSRKLTLAPAHLDEAEFAYHPGHLEEEAYEFLSRTPDDVTFQVVRTITMWSCCDEDERSPGCMAVPPFPLPMSSDQESSVCSIEFSHPDVFPDSDLERHHETLSRDLGPPISAVERFGTRG
ncbi:hypothetical protein NLJ89_g2250 [Agrocybe chaxingu]|uniref:Uncharacterized protein n=1 Tax=Agrocybe chaxingu TaxID=84603 RepID=A0A9W8K7Q4_9AGAR|nr:hypothetical protein NLJ89_g2250 [Agrocybe chaxingu]